MSDKISDIKTRAKEAMVAVEALQREAKAEGYALEVYATLGMDGQPSTRVMATLR